MTIEEFFEEFEAGLKKMRYKARVGTLGRIFVPETSVYSTCPICFVHYVRTGEALANHQFRDAADDMGLSYEDANTIAEAADGLWETPTQNSLGERINTMIHEHLSEGVRVYG
jgi:hypothetical protein